MVRVNIKPQHLVFCSHSAHLLAKHRHLPVESSERPRAERGSGLPSVRIADCRPRSQPPALTFQPSPMPRPQQDAGSVQFSVILLCRCGQMGALPLLNRRGMLADAPYKVPTRFLQYPTRRRRSGRPGQYPTRRRRSVLRVPGHPLRFRPETWFTTPMRRKRPRCGFSAGFAGPDTYSSRRRSCGNVVIPKGFPRGVGRVESRLFGFPCFPHPVISIACLGRAFFHPLAAARNRFSALLNTPNSVVRKKTR
jgi:hypothetical protein